MSRTAIQDADREEVAAFIEKLWRSKFVMSRGRKFFPQEESGFIERRDGKIIGLLTYYVEGSAM